MKINWFPGHMAKALRTMNSELKNIDIIIYILDARAPLACLNPEFNEIIKNKPVLIVLNKVDMADKSKISKAKDELKVFFKNISAIEIIELNSTMSGALKKILQKINSLCAEKVKRNREKGLNAFIKAMVIGVPNSGKSTFINNLCGKSKALTGNKPGVTRGKQLVNITKNVQLLDTPGTLYPNLNDEKSAKYLGYIGSIKDEVLDKNALAFNLIKDIENFYPNVLNLKYGIDLTGTPLEKIEQIAKSKNLLKKGGEIDFDRACSLILDDFKKGKFGGITLL
ncbi:MAG: ribosome biogenesis GTPase YlqF [Clostridia bacterium]|jgi:ribosome biogenesis GTPase A|nr:ribosome biogenesis GTPase YlqF [Clostridia bacterium]MDD3862832.1 ribosome biogenesis GTPase YlqF [Clostridia bacterium]